MIQSKQILYVCIGAAGAGKTTHSTPFCREFGILRLSIDETRAAYRKTVVNPSFQEVERMAFSIYDSNVHYFLGAGYSVLLDNMNHTTAIRAKYLQIAKLLSVRCFALFYQTNPALCIKRVMERDGHIPTPRTIVPPQPGEFDNIQYL